MSNKNSKGDVPKAGPSLRSLNARSPRVSSPETGESSSDAPYFIPLQDSDPVIEIFRNHSFQEDSHSSDTSSGSSDSSKTAPSAFGKLNLPVLVGAKVSTMDIRIPDEQDPKENNDKNKKPRKLLEQKGTKRSRKE